MTRTMTPSNTAPNRFQGTFTGLTVKDEIARLRFEQIPFCTTSVEYKALAGQIYELQQLLLCSTFASGNQTR